MLKPQTLWIALLFALGLGLTFSTGAKPTNANRHLQRDCVECARRFPGGLPDNPLTVDETVSLAPDKDACDASEEIPSFREGPLYTVFRLDSGTSVGFSVFNGGANPIIPRKAGIGTGPDREYSFEFPQRARQDIHFAVTDTPTEKLSERMESYFYVFPRKLVPSIQQIDEGKRLQVTLPTGETVVFDSATKEVAGGVLKENAPIDLGPDRFKRKFADVSYTGKGVMIRVDKRGADPRLGTIATITTGSPDPGCKGAACSTCRVESTKLWEQGGEVHFKFATDSEFDAFLKTNCKFGIPPTL